MTLLHKHLCLLLPYATETFRRSSVLLEESCLDKHVITKLHSKTWRLMGMIIMIMRMTLTMFFVCNPSLPPSLPPSLERTCTHPNSTPNHRARLRPHA